MSGDVTLPHRLSAPICSAHIAHIAHIAGPLFAALLLSLAIVAALRVETASAQTFTPGSQARVDADGDTLRMRAGATVSAAVITSIPDGTIVTIREGSQVADGYTWQFIEWNGAVGWVASEFLEPVDGSSTPSPTESPTITPTTTPLPSPTTTPTTPTPGGNITGSLPPSGKAGLIVWGGGSMDALVETAAGQGCNVRSIYTVRNGLFIGYTPGAPAFVNASWVSQVGDITGTAALLVFCEGSSTASAAPSGDGVTTVSAPPSTDNRPPGPGGNES